MNWNWYQSIERTRHDEWKVNKEPSSNCRWIMLKNLNFYSDMRLLRKRNIIQIINLPAERNGNKVNNKSWKISLFLIHNVLETFFFFTFCLPSGEWSAFLTTIWRCDMATFTFCLFSRRRSLRWLHHRLSSPPSSCSSLERSMKKSLMFVEFHGA